MFFTDLAASTADGVSSLPIVGSVFGILTAVMSTVAAVALVGIFRMMVTFRDDLRDVKGEVYGNPRDGEVGIREEVRRVKDKVDHMNGAP